MLGNVVSLFAQATAFGGGAILVWGAVKFGTALKDQNGPGISDAIWQMAGGAVIMVAGIWFSSLSLFG